MLHILIYWHKCGVCFCTHNWAKKSWFFNLRLRIIVIPIVVDVMRLVASGKHLLAARPATLVNLKSA